MELGKIPPNDVEAEQAVLGCMLLDKDAVATAFEVLKPEDFYREENKIIFSAMFNLYSRSEPIDLITVKDELVSIGKFEICGGIEYIADLSEKVPTTANADNYIKIVEEKSILRNLIKTSSELVDLGYNQTLEVDEIIEKAEKSIFDLMKNRNQKGYTPIKEILVETFAQLEKLYNQKEHITGIPTGFLDLDYKTAGLHGSELILVAARPAMGKTAFALNIATNAAVRANVPVAIFSLEMSKEQLTSRILATEAMIDSNKLKTGKMEEEDWIKLSEGLQPLSESEIYIDDTPRYINNRNKSKMQKTKT